MSSSLEWGLHPPLQGFGLEPPALTGVMVPSTQPWQQGPWWPPSRHSPSESWLLAPTFTIMAAFSCLTSPTSPDFP